MRRFKGQGFIKFRYECQIGGIQSPFYGNVTELLSILAFVGVLGMKVPWLGFPNQKGQSR